MEPHKELNIQNHSILTKQRRYCWMRNMMRNQKTETKWWNLVYSPPHPQKVKMMLRKPKLHFGLKEPVIHQIS